MADNLVIGPDGDVLGLGVEKRIFDNVWNSKNYGGNIHDGLPDPPAPKKTRWQSFLSACQSKTVNDVISKASLFLVPTVLAACITTAVLIPAVGIPLTLAATLGIGLGGVALFHNRKFWLRFKSSADWTDRMLSLHKATAMTRSDTEAGLKLLEHLPLGEDPYAMMYEHGMQAWNAGRGAAAEESSAPKEAAKASAEKDPKPTKETSPLVEVKVPDSKPPKPSITSDQLAEALKAAMADPEVAQALKASTSAPKPAETPKPASEPAVIAKASPARPTPVARGCSGPYPVSPCPCASSVMVR